MMGDFVLTAVKGVLKLVAAPAGLFLLLFLVAGLAMGWLVPILMTGKLVQREQVIIDLAGQTPVSITYHPCGTVGGMKGQAVKGEVSTHFPVCGALSTVSLRFKDFDAVCSMASMDDIYANVAPWRFRIVDQKCELISY